MDELIDIQALTIRLAAADDGDALKRLAERDSSVVPAAPVLIAAAGETLVAATSLADGRLIADPFRHSAGAARLLMERVNLLETANPRTERRRAPGHTSEARRPARLSG